MKYQAALISGRGVGAGLPPGVSRGQALVNAEQQANMWQAPPVNETVEPPVTANVSNPGAWQGETDHQGGGSLESMRPVFWPRRERTKAYTDAGTREFENNGGPLMWDRSGVEGGAQPWRIGRIHRPGMTLNAGLQQMGSQQSNYRAMLPPPIIPSVTRGSRSVSGVLNRVASADKVRVPAVFVPRSVM